MVKFEQGDIIWLNFNPQAGHEQQGRRPAIIVSNNILNSHSVMLLVCPITHTDKQHPFHIPITGLKTVDGVILCDQVRTLDINARKAEFAEHAPEELTNECVELVKSFL